jgi:predicted NUDIX family NTP pyrophosphohydrolase
MSVKKKSAGILMFRDIDQTLEVLLAHPGGSYWKNKDEGVWTIPKGEYEDDD